MRRIGTAPLQFQINTHSQYYYLCHTCNVSSRYTFSSQASRRIDFRSTFPTQSLPKSFLPIQSYNQTYPNTINPIASRTGSASSPLPSLYRPSSALLTPAPKSHPHLPHLAMSSTATSLSPKDTKVPSPVRLQPPSATATASGPNSAPPPLLPEQHPEATSGYLLAVCRDAEDEERVTAVAREVIAAADEERRPPALVLHIDPATMPHAAGPALDAAAVRRQLTAYGSLTMGRVLLAAASLSSTQEVLRSHGSALGNGAVVVADCQTQGKGRGGNQWTSPSGCLMFSTLRRLKVQSPSQAPFINYLVCLALTRGVARALQESGLPPLPLRIKWPNDVYAGGLKVAGALIHTTWQGGCFNVITGIGLNVHNRHPTTCLDQLLDAAGAPQPPHRRLTREAVLAAVLAALEQVYDTFETQGFAPLESEYLATWLHSGQVLEFDSGSPPADVATGHCAPNAATGGVWGAVSPAPSAQLTIRGLSPGGFLLAEDAVGSVFELTPDGNSLDMMKGLIRRKVQ